MSDVLTYCEGCLENLDDDKFDYRFDFPICHDCVREEECVICGDCLYPLTSCDCRRVRK